MLFCAPRRRIRASTVCRYQCNLMEFYTTLSPEMCRERLLEVVDTRRFTLWPESHYKDSEVVGAVRKRSFCLRKRLQGRNSFAPALVATMRSEGSGTAIKAIFRLPLFTIVFMTAFPLLAVNFILVGFGWAQIIIPAAIALTPFVMYAATRKQASQERVYLQDFIIKTLRLVPQQFSK